VGLVSERTTPLPPMRGVSFRDGYFKKGRHPDGGSPPPLEVIFLKATNQKPKDIFGK